MGIGDKIYDAASGLFTKDIHRATIEQKDAEIASLRQQLAQAREEAGAAILEVVTIESSAGELTDYMARLDPAQPPTTALISGSTATALTVVSSSQNVLGHLNQIIEAEPYADPEIGPVTGDYLKRKK